MTMPRFNETGSCPKCGCPDVHAGFAASGEHEWKRGCGETREHIHRSCRRCGYGWKEAPLDAPASRPEESR